MIFGQMLNYSVETKKITRHKMQGMLQNIVFLLEIQQNIRFLLKMVATKCCKIAQNVTKLRKYNLPKFSRIFNFS